MEITDRKKRILVVVDVQRDFFDPSGSLYVPGSEVLPGKIAAAAAGYDAVIFTVDWHPGNHCSFKEQGGPWPSHCVAYTEGAGLSDLFSPILALGQERVAIFEKGTDPLKEQYGAFENEEGIAPGILEWLTGADEIHVCGIAGDYCVKESTANLLRYVPACKVAMLTGLIRSIDDGSALEAFIEERGLSTSPWPSST